MQSSKRECGERERERAQKHLAHDTNTHVTHCGTNFPALQNWMRTNVAKSGSALVTNEMSAHWCVCGWCVKPRWQISAPAGNLQLLRPGNSCWGRHRMLWGIIPLDYRPQSAIWWTFIYLHAALNRRGWWEHVTLWCSQRRLDFTESVFARTWKWKSSCCCVASLVMRGFLVRSLSCLSFFPLFFLSIISSSKVVLTLKWRHSSRQLCFNWNNSAARQCRVLHMIWKIDKKKKKQKLRYSQ